jgi:hypothetical protein
MELITLLRFIANLYHPSCGPAPKNVGVGVGVKSENRAKSRKRFLAGRLYDRFSVSFFRQNFVFFHLVKQNT